MSYGKTARALDDRTLGHQRVEALELLELLLGGEKPRGPAARMWFGYEYALAVYGMMMCMEWVHNRGCADNLFFKFYNAIQDVKKDEPDFSYIEPPWFRDADVLRSHRSNLVRRQRELKIPGGERYTAAFGRATPKNMPYLWPLLDQSGTSYKLLVSKAEREMLRTGERALPDSMKSRVKNLD